MQISLVKLTPIKADTPKTSPPPPSQQRKLKKIQLKPKLKKQPVKAAAADFSPLEQVLAQSPVIDHETAPLPAAETDPASSQQPAYTEAYVNPAYEHNPKPDYPAMARSRGWQGKVLLKVAVKEDGQPESAVIEQSSGYDQLDESALEAVKNWRFVPARRGDEAVASSVLIPIIFSLQEPDW